ncbi:NUDIX hydrolase [Bacteroidota bacterium]
MTIKYLEYLKRIQSLAKTGIIYAENPYDLDRCEEINKLSLEMLALLGNTIPEKIEHLYMDDKTYPTPKVDVRGVVFKNKKILMVQEKTDSYWSLPGGWADIGYSASEIAEKEVFEESGLKVKSKKLLAVMDITKHYHPPSAYYIYKIFILCEITGGKLNNGYETKDTGFFGLDELPELSTHRITTDQIKNMFEFYNNPEKPALFD